MSHRSIPISQQGLQDNLRLTRPLLRALYLDAERFTTSLSNVELRGYQLEILNAAIESTVHHRGLTFVVMLPRQSGKNELQAVLETYLLTMCSKDSGREIVKVSPTWDPQALHSMRRLEKMLNSNYLAGLFGWEKESGFIYRVGRSRIAFLSGSPGAHVVGASASLLLECDEAQDVLPEKWDRDFAPMAASTNATRIFWGTAWTANTLLSRELRLAREAEARDGVRRAFVLTAEEVGREVPAYREFVEGEVAKHGRTHPFVRSQYYSEEIDLESGMFNERRLALMQGSHPRRHSPEAGKLYALLIDVAGEDKAFQTSGGNLDARSQAPAGPLANPARDSTALTVVEVDLASLSDELLRQPTYRVVERQSWTGLSQAAIYGQVRALALHWRAQRTVIDATGIGAGLASFLEKSLPGRVVSFVFNFATKSRLGWDFLSLVETGRFKDYACPAGSADPEQEAFNRQARLCQMVLSTGPEQRLKWGVLDNSRDPLTGEPAHDDWLISAALTAVLDREPWNPSPLPLLIQRGDPLEEMEKDW